MLDDLKKEFEQIRQAIADGEPEAAIQMLSLRCTPGESLHDSLVLLETRLSNLQQSVIEGVISREDETIERNSISKGLLVLLKSLETRAKHPLEPQALPPEQVFLTSPDSKKSESGAAKPQPFLLQKRKWAAATMFFVALAAVWGIWSFLSGQPAAGGKYRRDVTIRLSVEPSNLSIGPLGKAQIEAGKYRSELVEVPSSQVLTFKNLDIDLQGDKMKLRLPDLRYEYDLVLQEAKGPENFFFKIVLKTNTFSGKVLNPSRRPVEGVQVEIEDGLARATTDVAGNFSLTLPVWGAGTAQLVLRRGQKVMVKRTIGLDPAVFRELKIPD
jgi:hypothetical protein